MRSYVQLQESTLKSGFSNSLQAHHKGGGTEWDVLPHACVPQAIESLLHLLLEPLVDLIFCPSAKVRMSRVQPATGVRGSNVFHLLTRAHQSKFRNCAQNAALAPNMEADELAR